MIPGLALIEKLVTFAIDLFIRNRERNDELKRSFDKFFKRSANDSKDSADMHEQYDKWKKETKWPRDTN